MRKNLCVNAELRGTCRTEGVRLSQPKTRHVSSSLPFHISTSPCPTGALECVGHEMNELAMPVKNHPIQKGRQCSGALRALRGFPSPSHISGLGPRLHFTIFQFVSSGNYCYHEDVNKHKSQTQRPVLDSPSVQPEILSST